MLKSHKIGATTIAVAGLIMLSACSGSDNDSNQTAESGELTEINVGVIPIVDVAPLYLGVEEGVFEEHGLEVNLQEAQGGAAIVPGIQAGDFDFGFSNITSLVIASSQGLPLQIVAPGPNSTGDPDEDFAGVLVPDDSDIDTIEDLDGASVSINTLNNINDTVLREGMSQAGGAPSSMDLVEVAFPDMQSQVESGNLDGMLVVEPFKTLGENAGMRSIYAPYAEPTEDLTVAAYFASQQMIESDPDTVDAFAAAMRESQQLAEDEPDAAKDIMTSYITIDEDILPDLTLPSFPQEVNTDSIETMIDWSVEYGLVDEKLDVDDMMYQSQ